jgi:prevent-host-death family protein
MSKPRIVTIHQAKTNLSKLLAAVEAGEEIVIARKDKPVAKLVPLGEVKPAPKRGFGSMKGQFEVGPEFFEPLPDDMLELWGMK